jgi:hypothetical protein
VESNRKSGWPGVGAGDPMGETVQLKPVDPEPVPMEELVARAIDPQPCRPQKASEVPATEETGPRVRRRRRRRGADTSPGVDTGGSGVDGDQAADP